MSSLQKVTFLNVRMFDRSYVIDNDLKITSGSFYPVVDDDGREIGRAVVSRDYSTDIYFANIELPVTLVKFVRQSRCVVDYSTVKKLTIPPVTVLAGAPWPLLPLYDDSELETHFEAVRIREPQGHLTKLPVLIDHLEDLSYKCNCGAKYTAFSNIHSSWCDAYTD